MKNIVIDNQGLQSQNKTKLESQIEQLKSQEQQLTQQLKTWLTKAKKATNLANCLAAAEKFARQFLATEIENARNQEPVNNCWLESLIGNQVEFHLKFEAGSEAFAKLILASVEKENHHLNQKLDQVQSQLQHEERKFVRLQARRQGKMLLNCEYKKPLGCFGEYQCQNCQVNYSVSESNQLKGGSY